LKNFGSGEHSWKWDGKSGDGLHVPKGIYQVNVSAKNGDQEIPALTFIEGIADKVRFSESGVRLIVNGIGIPLGDVEEIGI